MEKRLKRLPTRRIRLRHVSWQDIEALSPARDTKFKREVRHALSGQVHSPLDGLIGQEELNEDQKREIQSKRRFNRIVKYAGLTSKQLACYKLSKSRRNPTLLKIAKKLGIGVSSAWSRLDRAERKIEQITIRFLEGRRIDQLIPARIYRRTIYHIYCLYYKRGWPPKKIAKALHKNLSSIYKNIQMLKWLAHGYFPKEARRPQVFEIEGRKISISIKKPSKKPCSWTY